MSPLEPHQKTKKRKHAAPGDEPSSKRSKLEKVPGKGEKGVKDTEGGKHKAHAHAHAHTKKDAKGKAKAGSDEFTVVQASLALSIPPVFATNLRAGAEEMLDSMVMRYIPALQGVVLAHDNLRFLESMATVKADCPFANCRVSFDATVWSPHVGMRLVGKVNLCSPDHVSLLVHRTFNVSIPRHHIPADSWEFEYGPAENDPEFGAAVHKEDAALPDSQQNADEAQELEQGQMEGSGRWVHKLTGTKLGGPDGYLEFTVIGLTIANQMLSLVGSIQSDPFSPTHVPDNSIVTVTSTAPRRPVQAEPQDIAMDEDEGGEEGEAAAENESDEDAFEALGRMGDEATARKAKEEADKKERKRKRKEEKAAAKEKEKDAMRDGKAKADAEGKKKRKKTS
ncbi:hypothetical protein EIP86_005086 [Pleurotus ostreatoroseus]|nr:hypothetical protein EIP86_005086 [Pleurotus ostreatoroseus]